VTEVLTHTSIHVQLSLPSPLHRASRKTAHQVSFEHHERYEELVVLGITAFSDGDSDFHKIGVMDKDSQKGHASVFGQVAIKLWLMQDLG